MERVNILRQIIFKFLLDVPHHPYDFLGTFGKAQRRWRGSQSFSTAHKEFGVKFVSKIMELETHGAWRQMNLLRRACHAGGVQDRQEQLELVNIHLPAPILASCVQRHTYQPP